MAREVAGDAADVESITKPGSEIHGYDPTPKDIVKAQQADLVLWNGMNLELWFEKFFQNVKDVPVRGADRRRDSRWASPKAPTPANPIPTPGCRRPTR
jgi:ABC-type Zn uptake system ZnuABC Zn-binding protein ZnuA